MGLKIFTTGLEQYAPGGNARVKVLIIGGPGVGKTRSASYWPKPIYADSEGGLASVADRKVPAVSINNSRDMLDLLEYLKTECRKPEGDRRFKTVVIDTLDTFQRKVKDEWLQAHPSAGSFSGFDAWGYLDAKMQMLLTRLLNLDMNVYVAVHPITKQVTEGSGEGSKQREEIQLQLSGNVKDQVFNDFDLVGWMGKYYAAEDGQRVEKRGLTFKATPEKPFLKDRLHVTPPWLDITFSDEDFTALWSGLASRLDDMDESQDLGEIPSVDGQPTPATAGVVTPDAVADAALPPVDPKEVPLVQWDRPTLNRMCKEEGVTTTVDGVPIKGNTGKGELVAALQAHRDAQAKPAVAEPAAPQADSTPVEAPVSVTPEETTQEPAPNITTAVVNGSTVQVDTATGEVVATIEATHDEAVQTVEATLGGTVESDTTTAVPDSAPSSATAVQDAPAPAAAPTATGLCESCGTDLANEKPDFVKLSYIKFRKRLCEGCYKDAKKG